jgi:hypothetical protein
MDHELLEGELALRQLLPELEALVPPFKRRAVRIPHCVSVLLGSQPAIDRMLPFMPRYTPLANAGRISRMRDYALAAAFVHHRSLPRPPTEPPEQRALIEGSLSLRRRISKAAIHLADLGLLDPRRVREIRAGRGFVGTGDALLALATLFEAHWSDVKDNTPIERSELRHAAEQGAKLLALAAERRERIHGGIARDDVPRRAAHMMCEVYEEARRVAAYICWYEPEVRPLPSLYRRASRGHTEPDEPMFDETTDTATDQGEQTRILVAAE